MHEFDRDPSDQNRRDILIVIALIGAAFLISTAWWESKNPRPIEPAVAELPQ